MVVFGLGRISIGQWSEELAPANGFNMAIQKEGVDHEIVAWNWTAGLAVPLVKRRVIAAAGIIDLVLCDA